jgi:hypothetical protein
MPDNTRMFIARREPGPPAQTSTDIYVDTGKTVDVAPFELLEQNINTPSLVAMLAERLGLPYVQAETRAPSTREPYRIDLNHALFFNFLRDDELVKPTQLFHREDEEFVPQSIRDVLPYFVGAMSEDRIPLLRDLQQERRSLRLLQRELPGEAMALLGDDPRALELVAEARAQGLISQQGGSALELLVAVDVNAEPELNLNALAESVDKLRGDRDVLLSRQRALRARAETIRGLMRDEVGLAGELDAQHARLTSIGLASRIEAHAIICPVCSQEVRPGLPTVETLRMSLQRVDRQLATMKSSRPQLETAIGEIERQQSELVDQLRTNQAQLNGLERQQMRLQDNRPTLLASERVKGKIEMYLTTRDRRIHGGTLTAQVEASKARVRELEERLSWDEIDERMTSLVDLINDNLTDYARRLSLEHTRRVRLDYRRLTVVATTEDGSPLRLEHIGSGANSVGYHLATYSALQHWFASRNRPVPRFVFFDQPTQPYYVNDPELLLENDDDRLQVDRMFRFLLDLSTEIGVQVIVTDHALLGGLPGFTDSIVANWHGDDALIPIGWPRRDGVSGNDAEAAGIDEEPGDKH